MKKAISVFLVAVMLLSVLTLCASAATSANNKLSTDKDVYKFGEKITVKATGSGKDWVGICPRGGDASFIWEYVTSISTSGKDASAFSHHGHNYEIYGNFMPGEYDVYLISDDHTVKEALANSSYMLAKVSFTIVENTDDPVVSGFLPPEDAFCELADDANGYAKGSVTVYLEGIPTTKSDIVMYWADEDGRLEGYAPLAKFMVKASENIYTFPDGMIIPEGADRLHVYTMNSFTGELSDEYVEAELPENAGMVLGTPVAEFAVVSDVHINGTNTDHTRNFTQMLKDVAAISPNSSGIFVNGDISDDGSEVHYQTFMSLYNSVDGAADLYLGIGNHDLYESAGKYNTSLYDKKIETFCKYATLPDGTHPDSASYDFWLDGYHFIFVGTDSAAGWASHSKETLEWLDETIAEDYDPGRPVFLFLHQSVKDTVAGGLTDRGQQWHGVSNDSAFKAVVGKYPEAVLFNGHSHWVMDSVSNAYLGDDSYPNTFNTASVAYLWTDYTVVGEGAYQKGSEGYIVELYEDRIMVRGRDFYNGLWIPSAQYCIEYESDDSNDGSDGNEVTKPGTDPATDAATDPATNAPAATDGAKKSGCGSTVGASAVLLALSPIGIAFSVKRKRD